MALQILEHNGTFYAKGEINTSTLKSFNAHIKAITENCKTVNLNIDAVKEIDKSGIETLKSIYLNALRYNRTFMITGYGCKEIYDQFRFEHVA